MMTYDEIKKNINILLADDDQDYLLMTYSFLKSQGYKVDKVTDGKQAIEALENKDYQIALLDYFMPEFNGEEVIEKVRETNKQLIIILQTGFSGQKPPIETMQRLNIQNYFDKTEGIDRLHLEIISAVKIFKQQNEIELAKYKQHAIGALVAGIAQEIKSDLLSISGSIELMNMLVKSSKDIASDEELTKLNDIYVNNKNTLQNVDKVLTAIIKQSSEDEDFVIAGEEVITLANLILKNDVKIKKVDFTTNVSLRPNSYIKGNINDIVFLTCEIIKKILDKSEENDKIDLSITEDENTWLIYITSANIYKLPPSFIYLVKMLMASIKGSAFSVENNDKMVISLLKTNI